MDRDHVSTMNYHDLPLRARGGEVYRKNSVVLMKSQEEVESHMVRRSFFLIHSSLFLSDRFPRFIIIHSHITTTTTTLYALPPPGISFSTTSFGSFRLILQ